MGKKRITIIDENQPEKKAKQAKEKAVRVPGMKGGERLVVVDAGLIITDEKPATTENTPLSPLAAGFAGQAKKNSPRTKVGQPRTHAGGLPRTHVRGKKYKAARTKVDPTKEYNLSEAVKLVKETSTSKFNGSVEAHFVALKKGIHGEANLPYLASKSKKVEIASKDTLVKIDSGKIDFDVLISTPAFMTNLVKYAKVLGPKGLMPNPKNGTITDDPEKAVQKFQKESFSFRTEANAPLIHSVIGKTSQKEEELEANLKALIQAIGPNNIKKAVLSSSMGPGVKINLFK
ncbi:MAG: hypothetical protein Q8Q24_00860 [bacterium]|nr:hypothetical protein [bacterium]